VANLRQKKRGNVINLDEKKANEKKKSLLFRIAHVLWALSLAREKKKKIRIMLKARIRSMVVLCDRYPQTQFYGYNDGPLLGEWLKRNKGLKRKIALWETSIYNLGNLYPPDITLKLTIPVDIAVKRKIDTPRYVLEKKARAVSDLNIGRHIVNVDSSGSVEDSMKMIKKEIWGRI
jgi:thymidylate kinase